MDEDKIVDLSPDKHLTFTWEKASDSPTAILNVANTSNNSFIAYKVKTTAPKRYVVRPPQGIIDPSQTTSIKMSMVAADAARLWADGQEERARGGELKSDDKFLVQTSVVSFEFFANELKDKDEKTQAAALVKLWKDLGDAEKASAEGKKAIKSSKLTTKFAFPKDMTATATETAPLLAKSVPDLSPAPLASSAASSPEAVFAELAALRKKYDDLVAYTVVLTGERDFLQQDCQEKTNALSKANAEKDRMGKSGTAVVDTKTAGGGGLVQIVVVALVAFIIGRLLA